MGYGRYDTEEQLAIIKDVLPYVELYVNLFQPVFKLKEKVRLGSKVKKRYDIAKTPYQRLVTSGVLAAENLARIQKLYASLNPVELKRNINRLTVKLNRTLRYKIHDSTNT